MSLVTEKKTFTSKCQQVNSRNYHPYRVTLLHVRLGLAGFHTAYPLTICQFYLQIRIYYLLLDWFLLEFQNKLGLVEALLVVIDASSLTSRIRRLKNNLTLKLNFDVRLTLSSAGETIDLMLLSMRSRAVWPSTFYACKELLAAQYRDS